MSSINRSRPSCFISLIRFNLADWKIKFIIKKNSKVEKYISEIQLIRRICNLENFLERGCRLPRVGPVEPADRALKEIQLYSGSTVVAKNCGYNAGSFLRLSGLLISKINQISEAFHLKQQDFSQPTLGPYLFIRPRLIWQVAYLASELSDRLLARRK